ncbi:MAG: hypothetical protein EGQ34_04475 [Sutterella sp.]|mgnify:CR=1 FL=1|nr:hypothetical protein [Sutterella sp.]
MSSALETRNPLPLGQSDFRALRDEKCVYVDKTALMFDLCRGCRKVFVTRPRRFGKSLLVSTFEALFKYGLRDFHGLAIEKLWTDKTYAVVRLDFSLVRDFSEPGEFASNFHALLRNRFATAGFQYDARKKRHPLMGQLSAWFGTLHEKSLVLLIDEYDAPLTASIGNRALFDAACSAMRAFFQVLEANGRRLRFCFMTGITRFREMSSICELRQFEDLSLDPALSTLLGFTGEEVEEYFGRYLREAAEVRNVGKDELLEKLREYYEGYSFDLSAAESDSRTRRGVFSPWPLLNFFLYPEQGFEHYWCETGGQPAVLKRFLADHDCGKPAQFDAPHVLSMDQLGEAGISEEREVEALLFQAGYLTIRKVRSDGFAVLGYPNREVALYMADLYADELLEGRPIEGPADPLLSEIMATGNLDEVVRGFNQAVGAIDQDWHPIDDEATCCTYLQVLLMGAEKLPKVGNHSTPDSICLEAEAGARRWVFEIKFTRKSSDAQKRLEEAAMQISARRYSMAYSGKKILRAALVFSGEERRFAAWKSVVEEP